MNTKNIHKKVLKRLAGAWLVLSLIAGGAVFYWELESIDDMVVGMATEQSEIIYRDHIDYLTGVTSSHHDLSSHIWEHHMRDGRFVIIEIYNKGKKRLIEAVHPSYEHIEHNINRSSHDTRMIGLVNYRKFYIDQIIYLQIFSPIMSQPGNTVGYFEGVYKVDAHTMGIIKDKIAISLLQVLLSILGASIIFYPIIININKGIIETSMELSKANIGMLEVLGSAIAKRDSDTSSHNYRVAIYSIRLAEEVKQKPEGIHALMKGAFLHDIGKIGISDNILLKEGKLTHEEFENMKAHVDHGMDIVSKYAWLSDAADVVRYHHEKIDGSGYMCGLCGSEIPLNARIFTIADVFDALTSKRPYKKPYEFEKAMAILDEGRGTHFDPFLLDSFKRISRTLYDEICESDLTDLEYSLQELIRIYSSGSSEKQGMLQQVIPESPSATYSTGISVTETPASSESFCRNDPEGRAHTDI